MEKKDENKKEEGFAKIYEIGYHIIPAVAIENLSVEVDNIKNFLVKEGVEIISEDFPKLRDLAYAMLRTVDGMKRRFDTAYFGWIKFDTGETPIAKIKKFLDENENILRYLLINTIKENTIFSAKTEVIQGKGEIEEIKKEKDQEMKTKKIKSPISEEDLDKTIDNLIAE